MTAVKHIILYIEDDLDDVFIVQQAFEAYNESIAVVHASNGLKALEFLNGLSENDLTPCLIILDMNMPGMDGRETLVSLKQSPKFRDIPVVVFTTSSNEPDKEFARRWDAGFITKPIIYSELNNLAKTFVDTCKSEVLKRA
jgi:CheY-like chemotaxis protein